MCIMCMCVYTHGVAVDSIPLLPYLPPSLTPLPDWPTHFSSSSSALLPPSPVARQRPPSALPAAPAGSDVGRHAGSPARAERPPPPALPAPRGGAPAPGLRPPLLPRLSRGLLPRPARRLPEAGGGTGAFVTTAVPVGATCLFVHVCIVVFVFY